MAFLRQQSSAVKENDWRRNERPCCRPDWPRWDRGRWRTNQKELKRSRKTKTKVGLLSGKIKTSESICLFFFFLYYTDEFSVIHLFQERKTTMMKTSWDHHLHQRRTLMSVYWRRWKWRSRREETPNQEFLMSESGTEAKVSFIYQQISRWSELRWTINVLLFFFVFFYFRVYV